MQIVDTYVLTVHCEFQRVRITGVPLARWGIPGQIDQRLKVKLHYAY